MVSRELRDEVRATCKKVRKEIKGNLIRAILALIPTEYLSLLENYNFKFCQFEVKGGRIARFVPFFFSNFFLKIQINPNRFLVVE